MSTFAILATGPSLTPEVVAKVKDRCKVIAISDAYRLAPFCDVLVSSDAAWWNLHKEARELDCAKYIAATNYANDFGIQHYPGLNGAGSALLAVHVAAFLGAKKILLLGLDMRGSHFFGPHPKPLKNTTDKRFEVFKNQLAQFKPEGVQILNCTPNSALRCYPFADLEEQL